MSYSICNAGIDGKMFTKTNAEKNGGRYKMVVAYLSLAASLHVLFAHLWLRWLASGL
jgi:hypothetical protein